MRTLLHSAKAMTHENKNKKRSEQQRKKKRKKKLALIRYASMLILPANFTGYKTWHRLYAKNHPPLHARRSMQVSAAWKRPCALAFCVFVAYCYQATACMSLFFLSLSLFHAPCIAFNKMEKKCAHRVLLLMIIIIMKTKTCGQTYRTVFCGIYWSHPTRISRYSGTQSVWHANYRKK